MKNLYLFLHCSWLLSLVEHRTVLRYYDRGGDIGFKAPGRLGRMV